MATTSVARISLATGVEPVIHNDHAIKVRARVQTGTGELKVALYEGGTNRSGDLTTGALTTSLADYSVAISALSAANINSYANLELRFWGDSGALSVPFEVDYLALEIPAGAGASAEHSAISVSAQVASPSLGARAGHASITVAAYEPLATSVGSPSGANAGHARITLWASDGGYSDLDSDTFNVAATLNAYQPSVGAKTTALHSAISVSAYDAIVSFGATGYAGHAAIIVGATPPAHGVSAEHATISAAAAAGGKSFAVPAGLASSQFSVSAYDADISAASIVNVLAGHASVSVVALQGSFSISSSAGHASVTVAGYDITLPTTGAALEVEVYDAVTLDVLVSRYVEVSLDVEVY